MLNWKIDFKILQQLNLTKNCRSLYILIEYSKSNFDDTL